MQSIGPLVFITVFVLLAGCAGLMPGVSGVGDGTGYEDLAVVRDVVPGQVYRVSDSGICGTVADGHIQVVGVVEGSAADGKIQPGDRVVALQYRGLGSNVQKMVAKRIGRLGRDWNWKLIVTVERPDALGGEGNRVSFHLRLPPPPGALHHFGPTGIYAKTYADHLVVEKVAEGSPADGILRPGDRILAVGGQSIKDDIFKLWTRCIDEAESEAGKGELQVTVVRPAGSLKESDEQNPPPHQAPAPASRELTALELALELPVLGSYSASAPVNCPKTDAIIAKTAEVMMESGKVDKLGISLLGLLGTGEKKYIDYVGKVLRESDFAKPDVELSMHKGYVSWPYGYHMMVMAEYYLITGDEYVLPALEKHAIITARGQDAAGLWNHRMANPEANFGRLHGRLYGYGAINQTSVTLFIGLILAERCGVDHPEVRAAIEKTHRHYSNWIGRGALPYGNHGYYENFLTNNGTSGSLAVAFSLLGNPDGARFFSRLSAAAHDEILTGHTGPYFNTLWSGLGANVAGPEVMAAFNRKIHWLRTMVRTWDGHFQYMLPKGNSFAYKAVSTDGSNLLNLCAGRQALLITGRKADRSIWVDGQNAVDWVEAGTIRDTSRSALLEKLGSHLPRVRIQAAQLLAVADSDVAAPVMKLLNEGTRDQRIGAVHAIGHLKINAAAENLMALAGNEKEDLWIRCLAARTLSELEGTERFATDMLGIILRDKPYDTRADLDAELGQTLVKVLQPDPYTFELDQNLFYAAVNKLLDHPRMIGRGAGMALIKNIPLEDFPRVADKVVYVIEDKDRTYTSYHGDGHRQIGLDILNRLNIAEVIPLTVNTIKEPTGRGGPRTRGRVRVLKTFGAEAKDFIPQIRELLGDQADEIIKAIEASETAREMIPLENVRKQSQ